MLNEILTSHKILFILNEIVTLREIFCNVLVVCFKI